jgi:HlyD family secretion protein
MPVGNRPSRKWWYIGIGVVLLLGGTAAGFATLNGASPAADPSKMAVAEQGTMVRSVVATGKIEPITKVEIKSKANGIIKALHVDVDSLVKPNDVLVELDREQLEATLRGAEANLQAARASLEGSQAALKKNVVEAEGTGRRVRAPRADRAKMLFAERLMAQSALDDAHSAVDLAENRKRAAQSQLAVSEAKVTEGRAQVAQAKAVADRDAEDLANATIRAPSVPRCSAATSRSAALSRRFSTSARMRRS